MNLGVPEIILILVVALLFFGPSRLPSLGKSVGEAIRGFKKGLSGNNSEEEGLAAKLGIYAIPQFGFPYLFESTTPFLTCIPRVHRWQRWRQQ